MYGRIQLQRHGLDVLAHTVRSKTFCEIALPRCCQEIQDDNMYLLLAQGSNHRKAIQREMSRCPLAGACSAFKNSTGHAGRPGTLGKAMTELSVLHIVLLCLQQGCQSRLQNSFVTVVFGCRSLKEDGAGHGYMVMLQYIHVGNRTSSFLSSRLQPLTMIVL